MQKKYCCIACLKPCFRIGLLVISQQLLASVSLSTLFQRFEIWTWKITQRIWKHLWKEFPVAKDWMWVILLIIIGIIMAYCKFWLFCSWGCRQNYKSPRYVCISIKRFFIYLIFFLVGSYCWQLLKAKKTEVLVLCGSLDDVTQDQDVWVSCRLITMN